MFYNISQEIRTWGGLDKNSDSADVQKMISWFDRCTAVAKTKSDNVWRDLQECAQSSLVRKQFASCTYALWREDLSTDGLEALSAANRPSNELFLDLAALILDSNEAVALRAAARLDEARLEAASHKHMNLQRKAPTDPAILERIAFKLPTRLMLCQNLIDEHREIAALCKQELVAASATTFFKTELKAESAMLALTSTGGELPEWLVGAKPDSKKIMELVKDKNILKVGGVSRVVLRLKEEFLAWSSTLTETSISAAVNQGKGDSGFLKAADDSVKKARMILCVASTRNVILVKAKAPEVVSGTVRISDLRARVKALHKELDCAKESRFTFQIGSTCTYVLKNKFAPSVTFLLCQDFPASVAEKLAAL